MTIDLISQDKIQRQLALDASQSFIVQAPAGSGKTELLIQRFLTLLNHVNAPEEILAITFTKKAANEMRARVIKALKHAQYEPEPSTAHGRQTWQLARKTLLRDQEFNWNLLNNPNQLRIQTIDSLCSFLTKQLPMLSHFGSQPQIADKAAHLYRTAVEEVLMHVEENYEWSEAISELLLHLDNDLNKLHKLLVNLLAKRDQWLAYIQLNSNNSDIKKQLEQHLSSVICDHLFELYDLFPQKHAPELLALVRYASDQLAIINPESSLMILRDATKLPSTTAQDKNAWRAIADFLLTNAGTWRKSFTKAEGIISASSLKNSAEKNLANNMKARAGALVQVLLEEEALRQALHDVRNLPEAFYDDGQWRALQALLHVLKIVAAQLRITFQQHGQIDYIQNSQAALMSLGDDEHPTDLALALDYKIQHILVDEFQDTSLSQYQLLEKLTAGWMPGDGRTLFVVGDPMQSIYRFREAEVGLFIRMRSHGIGQIPLTPITLSVNFRSTPQIVDWNNEHFRQIFPNYNNIALGAVTYSPSISNNHNELDHEQSFIKINGYETNDAQIQADTISSIIKETQTKFPNEKIAILVRSRPHLEAIIPALKNAGIPYSAIDIDPLASRQHIQDLLALTCALLHPADRIAWLAILRAPWCGLTLADLLVISEKSPYACIIELINDSKTLSALSEDGKARLTRILPIIKTKLAERDREDLRSWIETTWQLLGGPACLKDEIKLEDAHAYFQLLTKLTVDSQTIQLETLKEKMNDLYAAAQHADNGVQIMTIHSSKGLEFDTVILPHLEKQPASDDNSLLLWMERPLNNDHVALLLAPIHATGTESDPLYSFVRRQQKIKSDFETDRLFYVATTRAKKRLHVLFNAKRNAKNELTADSGSFLNKFLPLIKQREAEIITTPNSVNYPVQNESNVTRPIYRLASTWNNPVNHIHTARVATHLQATGFLLPDYKAKNIGILTHRILQQIANTSFNWWTSQDTSKQINFINSQLLQLGMPAHEISKAANTVINAVNNTVNDERGRWILSPHMGAASEYAMTAIIDGEVKNIVIDRTFIEDDIRWIIDYKTAHDKNIKLEDFIAAEEDKYREQMYKYAEAMQLREDRPIKLGLYFPAVPAWREVK